MAFWAVELTPNKAFKVVPPFDLHLTQVVLPASAKDKGRSVVEVKHDDKAFAIGSLKLDVAENISSDLLFEAAKEITFSVSGSNPVHLVGYFIDNEHDHDHGDFSDDELEGLGGFGEEEIDSDDEDDLGSDEDEDDIDEDELSSATLQALNQKRKAEQPQANGNAKKAKVEQQQPQQKADQKVEKKPQQQPQQKADQKVEQKPQQPKADQKSQKADQKTEKADQKPQQPQKAEQKPQQPKAEQKPQTPQQPKADQKADKAEQKPQTPQQPKAQQQKEQKGQTPQQPKAEQKSQTPQQPKGEQKPQTPQPKADQRPQTPEIKEGITRTEKGVKMETITIGLGATAQVGKKVSVMYTGRLENGKVFDKSRSPFKFTLGAGDVIQGWDIGVKGMRVGEKRKLTIPPALGYGAQGALPDIPKNATLIFDVELVRV